MIDDAGVATLPLASFRDSSRASAVELSLRAAEQRDRGTETTI
jgi:hypothetical protein